MSTVQTAGAAGVLERVRGSRLLWPVVALVALVVANAVRNPGFLSVRLQA